ncbi:Stress responsive A/B Barrel Domain [Roseivivax lentus]|uniref:Stress responsive A/B Barrel Domain n=1 Tax=Roseivivax lentus TaxID=633194 RepID=A0A1N7PYJ8_9RHOB|nr:Dabb family protein [Roseivivax lentus]SIT15509.1 Stress responsive A/B Barrel Domain [Roseivivax lentus]
MIRHLVFLKYADTVSQDAKDALMGDLAALADALDGIEAFCARPNISPETPLTHGLSEMFWIDFRDAAARDAYLANETHKTIGARLLASLEGGTNGIFVCDVAL